MAKLIPFEGFCGPTSIEGSPLFDAGRSQNLFPAPASNPAAKSRMSLYGRPGLSQINFACTIASPARALWAGNNRLFAAGGTHFYELSSAGGIVTDYGAMAGSGGTGPCQVISNVNQLLVMDSSAPTLYYAGAGSMSVPQVVDAGGASLGNMGAVALDYLDGFCVAIANAATVTLVEGTGANPNLLMVSNYLDGTKWQALNYAIRTGAPDLTTNLGTLNGQIWVFGQKTIEVWYNAGNPLFPFARIQGATINLGLLWPDSVVKFENTIIWAGADDRGYVKVYRANGLQPERISTFAIEQLIGLDFINQPVTAFGYQENGHTFYVMVLQAPGTFVVYDLTTGLWHERYYGTAWPVCSACVPGWGGPLYGPVFVGDGNSGKVMRQSTLYTSDLGGNIGYVRTAPHLSDADRWTRYSSFQLDGDIGTAQVQLSYSNDGGKTFTSPRPAISGSNEQGTANDGTGGATLPRLKWWQLGRSRDRVFRVYISDNANRITLVNAYLRASEGTE